MFRPNIKSSSGLRQTSQVRRGEPSGQGVIKTEHTTATPRLSTECFQFKRNERLYSKFNEQRILKTTTNPAYYQSQNRTKVEQPTPTT